MIQRIEIAGASRARRIKRRFDAVITIEDPGLSLSHRVRFHHEPRPPHLILAFEDLDDPHEGIATATPSQVEAALEFGRQNQAGSLLVHCHAGIARSTATAMALIADRFGPGREAEALDLVLRLQPMAVPNFLVLSHADRILGRDGHLVDAVRVWDSGLECNQHRRQTNQAAILKFYEGLGAAIVCRSMTWQWPCPSPSVAPPRRP